MQKLEPPDTHNFSAAIGWLELGLPAEARAALAQITPALQNHPDVLEARWLVAVEEKQWEEGLQIARTLLQQAPKRSSGWLHQAYALRRTPDGSVVKAWEALLPAFDRFPKEPIIPYNLACYACQMHQLGHCPPLDQARGHHRRAKKIKRMALQDPDLEQLRKEIKASNAAIPRPGPASQIS